MFGTLTQPIHAVNLNDTMDMIAGYYRDHIIVAVDASVGKYEHVGYITLGRGAIRPGLGVSKNLMSVGDIFITGIVGCGGGFEPLLQNTRLSVVMELAALYLRGNREYRSSPGRGGRDRLWKHPEISGRLGILRTVSDYISRIMS